MSKGYNPNRDKDGKFSQGTTSPTVPDPSNVLLNLPQFEASDTPRSAGEKINNVYRVWRTSQDEEVLKWHKEHDVPSTEEDLGLRRITLLDEYAGISGMWLSVSQKIRGANLSNSELATLIDYLSGFRDEIEDSYATAGFTVPSYTKREEPDSASSVVQRNKAWLASILHNINNTWEPLLHEVRRHADDMDFDTMWLLSDRIGRMYNRLEDANNTVTR